MTFSPLFNGRTFPFLSVPTSTTIPSFFSEEDFGRYSPDLVLSSLLLTCFINILSPRGFIFIFCQFQFIIYLIKDYNFSYIISAFFKVFKYFGTFLYAQEPKHAQDFSSKVLDIMALKHKYNKYKKKKT